MTRHATPNFIVSQLPGVLPDLIIAKISASYLQAQTDGPRVPPGSRINSFDLKTFHYGVWTAPEVGPVFNLNQGDITLGGFDDEGKKVYDQDLSFQQNSEDDGLHQATSYMTNLQRIEVVCPLPKNKEARDDSRIPEWPICILDQIEIVLHTVPFDGGEVSGR